MNPFLPIAEFPDFPAMTPAAADEAFPVLIAEAKRSVDALEANAPCEWDGFMRAHEGATRPLFDAWGIVSHLLSVCNTKEWRDVQDKYRDDIVAFSLRLGQSRRFYDMTGKLLERMRTALAVDPADEAKLRVRIRILEKSMTSAELAGVGLDDARRERFNVVSAELAKLGSDFRDHVMDATGAYSLELVRKDEVEGLPLRLKAALAGDGDAEKGPWKAGIDDSIYPPLMKHAACREVRERLCRARATRASSGAMDNTPLVARTLELRRELASLLGFSSYAELSLAEKCAPSVEVVRAMIDELAVASDSAAVREERELADFAAAAGHAGELLPWDRAYWAERRREREFDYSEEELSKYFDLPVVTHGLFELAQRLFGVAIEPADGAAPTWHEDVRFYRVRGEDGTPLAHFYFDPYARPGVKSGGAWMNELRTREVRADGSVVIPLALVCCNQAKPGADGHALMRFTEVETLFHEFGHALQQMLTTVDDAGASGLNLIDWDAVEVCSQFMENWCYDPATVKSFARHVETGEPIPDDLLGRVRAARNYRAANAMLRQLAFADIDLALHEATVDDPNALKNRLFDRYMPGSLVDGDRFLNSFTHIFAGGYAAGYYGYKWSEVMSADAFGAFEEAGTGDGAAMERLGRKFRDTFLALGGGVDPMEVFRRFRGRDPRVDALLRQNGLARS